MEKNMENYMETGNEKLFRPLHPLHHHPNPVLDFGLAMSTCWISVTTNRGGAARDDVKSVAGRRLRSWQPALNSFQ